MKTLSLPTFLLLATAAFAADTPRKIAFERGSGIWVANLDGTGAKKVGTGSWPDISRDGTKVAFTADQPSKGVPVRYIAVADVAAGQVTLLKDVPSNNCFGPIFSPDGTKLTFYIMTDDDWQLGLVNADGTGYRVLKKADPKGYTYYGAVWAPDGQSLYCQDMDTIYRIGLDGAEQKKWELKKLTGESMMNSSSRLAISPDGKTLLMDIDQAEEHNRKDWDGPQPAIWSFDLTTEKATRLTPKTMWAWQPAWLSDSEILFQEQPVKEKEPSIYRASLGDLKARKLVLKNARVPTASQ